MRPIKYIVIHHNGVPGRTVDDVRRTHLQRGWADIGYHYVIDAQGDIFFGRPVHRPGAHVEGLNSASLGICLIGNGNEHDFSEDQYSALRELLQDLRRKHPQALILGHRETGPYVKPPHKPTKKQCPGRLVDMDRIRAMAPIGDIPGKSPGDDFSPAA